MEKYIHRESLALLRKRLAEAQDDASRKVLFETAGRRGGEGSRPSEDAEMKPRAATTLL
jgi:hypothetical protein